jgi:hypothetical protein
MAQDVDAADRQAPLLTQARAVASLATEQADVSRQALQMAKVRWEGGLATYAEFAQAQRADSEADLRLKLAELDVAEIDAGGGPVRTEISAPLIDGRDFVSERLRIAFDAVSTQATLLEQHLKFAEARVQAGVATSDSVVALGIERARLAADAEQIRQTLALRQSSLAGAIDNAQELTR